MAKVTVHCSNIRKDGRVRDRSKSRGRVGRSERKFGLGVRADVRVKSRGYKIIDYFGLDLDGDVGKMTMKEALLGGYIDGVIKHGYIRRYTPFKAHKTEGVWLSTYLMGKMNTDVRIYDFIMALVKYQNMLLDGGKGVIIYQRDNFCALTKISHNNASNALSAIVQGNILLKRRSTRIRTANGNKCVFTYFLNPEHIEITTNNP